MSDYTNIKLPKTSKGRKSEAQKLQYDSDLKRFAESLIEIQLKIEGKIKLYEIKEKQKVSARGWCYLLENFNLITKDQFDYCQKIVNLCRKEGYLPIDFTAQDISRRFFNIEKLKEDYKEPKEHLNKYLRWVLESDEDKKDMIELFQGLVNVADAERKF
ncbi:hypothetical protein LCGC14_2988950, partial [marine sediment metagenome]